MVIKNSQLRTMMPQNIYCFANWQIKQLIGLNIEHDSIRLNENFIRSFQ